MGIIAWIVLGGLAGWLASIITKNNASMGLIKNIVVGILGAMIGGFVFSFFGGTGVTGFNLWSIFVAFIGAAILLFIINLFTKGN
ncbi:GlsB/YeaQ/YmgE family stress response membrane protein [Acetobacterium bakii]|uniref:Membrane protein n=1 Tax=Acetobacterium bakii TaxID=52689 RepID=A0A0L6U3S6_9FIRM|nr:GlsB/YeaQ/YmgE family stress response membrane protein [Acetobacterium bakii]KNZ43179.1 membrane protein [Acetobacterium bakii]